MRCGQPRPIIRQSGIRTFLTCGGRSAQVSHERYKNGAPWLPPRWGLTPRGIAAPIGTGAYKAVSKHIVNSRTGATRELLERAGRIRCPVLAIHGDIDPHPVEGVRKPLSLVLDDFRLVLLENCGHTPWRERRARERFYEVLGEGLAEMP